jgi:hypothetical protein
MDTKIEDLVRDETGRGGVVRDETGRGDVFLIVRVFLPPCEFPHPFSDSYSAYSGTYLRHYENRDEFLADQFLDVVSRQGYVSKELAADVIWPENKNVGENPCLDPSFGIPPTALVRDLKNPCGETDYVSKGKELILSELHSSHPPRPILRGSPIGKGPEDIPLDDVYAGRADDWVFPGCAAGVGIGILGREIRKYHEQHLLASEAHRGRLSARM